MKYRKKPVIVEAIQYTGKNYDEIAEWITGLSDNKDILSIHDNGTYIRIQTLTDPIRLDYTDWIIRGTKNKIYSCGPEIFKATYEKVES